MPNQITNVGFNDYSAEQADIDRRRAYAQALQQQGAQPIGPTEQVGGWAIRRSPLEGLAKMLQAYGGRQGQEDATERQRALQERQRGDFNADRSALAAALQGRPADAGVDDPTAGYAPPSAAQAPNPQALQTMDFRSPMFQGIQAQQLAKQLEPQKPVVVGRSLLNPTSGAVVGTDATWKAEQDAARKAKEAELQAKLADARVSREERAAAQQQLVQMQIDARREMAGQSADLRRDIAGVGKVPQGYRQTADGNLEAVPGGPADTKLQGVMNQDTAVLNSSMSSMDRLATAANEAMNHPGLPGTAGLRGAIPNIPGTQAADAAALLNTLKSQVAFGVLQDMRNNSKTGGALGAVSDAEGKRLEANLAALEKSQSVDQLRASLKKIIDYTQGAKDRLRDSFNLKHSGKAETSYAGPDRRAPVADPLGLRKK